MRFFIVFSLIIHCLSLAYFFWHKKQDLKRVQHPISTMVQIVPAPLQNSLKVSETRPQLKTETKNQLKRKSMRKPKVQAPTPSRKGPSAQELEYAQKLTSFIEKNRFYPKQAWRLKQQGTVVVSLTVLKDGTFTNIKIIEQSRYKNLDKAALSFLKALKKFEPLPNINKTHQEYVIPIFYKIMKEF